MSKVLARTRSGDRELSERDAHRAGGPVARPVAAEAEALPIVSVLMVDDRPENLLALEASLEPLGQRLVRASSGDAALRAVLDEQFAVILMDVRMPGLDGFETMALLKQRERSRHTPIIFLSAHPDRHQQPLSYLSGAVDYMAKPFDPDVLRSKVAVFVRLRQNELALQAAQAELEERVVARTAELAAAIHALQYEIVERKTAEQRLFDQAHHDHLTGLANRALFMVHLDRAVAQARRRTSPSFAVMMLDLDRFKLVNDSLGHLAGDRLLVEVSQRLARCLREVDTASRLGGDEFAILLDGIATVRDARRTADRIKQELDVPIELDGKEINVTASIGIVMMDPRYARGDELLRDADAAMYRAKQTGRARYQLFDREMHATVMAQLHLEADLCRAVEREELAIEYQPIVGLAEGHIVGFEALVRWRHPERGMISPAEFIPIAEDTGLIGPIGRWVLGQACAQLATWSASDLPELTMSVNMSPRQFAQPDLPSEIERVALEAGIDPRRLRLEITESAMTARVAVVERTLARCVDLGIAISLDDFGTGYSCLSYLQELSVTTLKIDRAFIHRIGRRDERPEIVEAIVSLAHNLGMDVTAEGIETAEQLARLRELGCEHGQGYYFARPMPADAAEAMLRRDPRW
jgi:diguanylate cyclase (GGDEF)-like protein